MDKDIEKINVVIIEDDPMVSMITEKIINSKEQFNVIKTFFKGQGVIDYLLENKVELIILDMYLPDTEGLNILEELREKEKEVEHYVNTIFVTASNSKDHIQKAFHLGVVDYLIKPFEFERLEAALERYLEIKSNNYMEKTILTQEEVDAIYHNINKSSAKELKLPKGINRSTLKRVLDVMKKYPNKELSSRDVADLIDSTSVTVKKYLDYLSENGQIQSNINYGAVGRPEVKYKFKM